MEPNKIGKEKSAPPESKARSFKCREMAEASIYQKTHHRQDTKEKDQCSITKIIDQKTGKKKKKKPSSTEITIQMTNQSSIPKLIEEKW